MGNGGGPLINIGRLLDGIPLLDGGLDLLGPWPAYTVATAN